MNRIGILALVFWAAHAASHVLRGTAHDLFWVCNVATPVLALGCFLRVARLCAISVCWLAYGVPIWLLDLGTGASLIPTSVLTHFGGLVLGVAAVRRLGWPRWTWLAATGASLLVLLLARIFTSPAHNVMLAFRVHDGWEKHFDSYPPYLALMLGASAMWFFAIETIARRFGYVRAST